MTAHDPRAIANLMLDEADQDGIQITNLALQKLLYFAHGLYLTQTKKPLVSGHFEAWQYGPVHPSAYRAFKEAGSHPITKRAQGKDPLTGGPRPLRAIEERAVVNLIRHVLRSYGTMSPGRLVDLSHAKGSPWDYVVDKSRTSVAFGLRISDNVIEARFKNHKVSVGTEPNAGEPNADTPLT
ncbi:MAG: Panacea domain-containing protein [Pseudomonadota bacterium]